MAKSVVKLDFSLHPLPVISHPKPPFFVRFGLIWGKNRLFRGVFLFSSRDFLARNLIFRRKNQFDGVFFRPKYRNSTFAGVEKRKVGVFSPLPHSTRKIQADFLSKRPHFSRLPPLFLSKPPYPDTNSHSILRAGHAPTRIYAPALSANLPFLPSPFTSPRNKLQINRLSVKANPAFTFTFTATTCNSTPCTTSIAKNR